MKSSTAALICAGAVVATTIIISSLDSHMNFRSASDLEYDVITINAENLRAARDNSGFQMIMLHSEYDSDWPFTADIHLSATAWRDPGGTDDLRWVAIEDELFQREDKIKIDNAVAPSIYPISAECLRYLLETIREAVTFKLTPEPYPAERMFVQYRVSAVNASGEDVPIDDRFAILNPSPPAKFR